jgi:hypothetical protein
MSKLIGISLGLALLLASTLPAFAQGCCTQTNGGGNVPSGTAVGVANTNQGGNAPPGQQPAPPGQTK